MASYWCYRCTRFIRVSSDTAAVCPYCDGGFVEAVDSTPSIDSPRHVSSPVRSSNLRFRRGRRNQGNDRPSFNPVIVLRGAVDGAGGGGGEDGGGERSFELYYDDGAGSGIRPLPPAVSEFLMGSGFDRLLEQLSQIDINGFMRQEQPPASKSAVESMPIVEIGECQVDSELHCAVCKEEFELGSEAREMPCKHLYHSDCILPWLSLRNSCPVCRHELPTDASSVSDIDNIPRGASPDGVDLGLTIWRLPGGGFAVGRFSGGRRAGEHELPAVYTEMDGGFSNSGGAPRRIAWASRRETSRRGSGLGRIFRNLVSFMGRFRSSNSTLLHHSRSLESTQPNSSISRSHSHSRSIFSRNISRRSRTLVLDLDEH
ncbi:E3 ubiquitin-protein ligase RDUF1-like [Impatiens glandulifera]|uniref:E3 ubiquitin-protein ligase RDUF1-like n=1 Tax=Impatiens glandulifera TaxID=253017 RepID=UPI001FB19482|nr:E3 ubiquitin-protein ligase RDUF1-like [Impatiens glandulifera]